MEPDKLVTANSRGFAGTFSEAVSPAAPHRIAAKAAGKGMLRFTLLVDSKTAALNEKLSRIDQAIAKILSNSAAHPEGKSLAKTARAFRSLVGRHQLPVDEAVKRALTAMTAEARSSKTASPSGLKSAHPSERLQTELMVLREFIGQQRAELNETLDILKALSGRATTYADPGDWSGPEKARGADPVQVVAFTLPMEDDQKPTRLKVFYPLKKRASTETGFRISLLLSMERMGPIRADIFTRRKTLEIKFSTETEPARRYIGDHLSRLSKLLDGHFETVNLTAAVDDKTIAAFEYEDLGLSDNRLVNLKA
ncbi:MAG: flagellar hook-length control protein FliK [Desulfobacterales bacterium]|nr:flagellar hook-length control protein FliK [Desulfobacterales bacterium]